MSTTRLSRYLSTRRDDAGMTTAKVHRAVATRGIDLTYAAVFRWFSGETRPDVAQLGVLGLVLGLSAAELIHALRLAAEDAVIGEVRTSAEPDPSVAPAA